jgi:hypothetical protein
MTRFSDDYDWDFGRYMLWEQAVTNAMSGRRGQAALRDLEEALVALPEKRLVDTLCKDGEVCAISALVVHKRVQAGEDRATVIAELERMVDPEGDPDAADITACLGARHGNMAYSMAWTIAQWNDEDCFAYTPEQRYEWVLKWVRDAQIPVPA